MRISPIFIALLLGGCAFSTIKEGMQSMVGQSTSALIGKLGFPTEERSLAGRKVLIWATGSLYEGTSYTCQIRAVISPNDIVESYDFEGNLGACNRYASRLR